MTTTEYPVRYSAFDNPGQWVEWHEAPADVPGSREYAAYHEPFPNRECPGLTEYIYVEIVRWWDCKSWLLDGQTSQPNFGRKQYNERQRYATYDEAKAAAVAYLERAQAFIAETVYA